ncbi:MAG: 1-acyl-sn-glycerol-3-phosphate acyltransferase [Bacilli bacterium]|nr:1-acyl-sn-glycerol-3-phosphate acyltransferase [Bacilli bacterium]
MAKKQKLIVYRVLRVLLSPLYKFWYRPTILGAENIPEEGRFIIVGNHIHIFDQCNVLMPSKRILHYMAKKEYFDPKYPEGHHSWFFKSSGCIPVDRSKKDDAAVASALDVLENDHALGLFPEGTRNGLKEDRAREIYAKYLEKQPGDFKSFYKQAKNNKTSFVNYLEELLNNKTISFKEFVENITCVEPFLKRLMIAKRITEDDYYQHIFLPFKFGAVSMAKKTNSVIVPFVITGDYHFRTDNLVVRIGRPLEPMDDLAQANERLEETMREMIKENHRMSGK